jgi:thioredoxin reductase
VQEQSVEQLRARLSPDDEVRDVIVVGGGPARLSAALILGRCRRRVLVCDAGRPRNAASHGLHGFLTRDGIEPAELLRIGREQLRRYDSVELREVEVADAKCLDNCFEVTLSDGARLRSRKLLLTTGVVDHLPEVAGIEDFYGRSVFHCPYCDGWEMRDEPLAIYGRGEHGRGLALELTAWSRDLILCTDGSAELTAEDRRRLAKQSVEVREERIARLEGTGGVLERIVFTNGATLARRALFFSTGQRQHSDLPTVLGCEFTEKGAVQTGEYETTNVPGLYVAGDASRLMQLAIVAAAEGAQAAFAINTALLKEDLDGGRSR